MQSNLKDVIASLNGIKVVLSMVSSSNKHLPPHAQEMLSPSERTVATTPSVENPGEAGDKVETAEDEGHAQTVLGLSKKDPERKRCVRVSSHAVLVHLNPSKQVVRKKNGVRTVVPFIVC